MDAMTMAALGKIGGAAALTLAAVGSGMGAGTAGMAAVGAWKKCYVQDKPAPFLLLIFIGAPLSQTIYGMILMNAMVRACSLATYVPAEALKAAQEAAKKAVDAGGVASWTSMLPPDILATATQALSVGASAWPAMVAAGLLGGLAIGLSALWQGRAGSACADSLAETGQGFGNYLMTIGVVETVALFVLVFLQTALR